MVQICTDSCADLSRALIAQHQVKVIPLQVFINDQNIKDGDITIKQLFEMVALSGQLPKTAAPSLIDFKAFFEGPEEVIFIGISSQLSATIQVAQVAAGEKQGAPVYIVDSKNLSTGIGLLALWAADRRDAGWSAPEIAAELAHLTAKVRSSFMIDTMEYLYKGGRCNGLQALAGSLLQIRPIIAVQPDGTLAVKHKIRGSRTKALNTLLADFEADLPGMDLRRVFVTHAACEADAAQLVDKIKSLAPIEEVLVTEAGATIGSHCGPNTIGILYLMR